MARIVHTASNARERSLILRQLAAITEEAANKPGNWKDLTAYVCFALLEIRESVDKTANAWERRGYWVKSDQFRRRWDWVENLLGDLDQSLMKNDEGLAKQTMGELASQLSKENMPSISNSKQSWDGAYDAWENKKDSG